MTLGKTTPKKAVNYTRFASLQRSKSLSADFRLGNRVGQKNPRILNLLIEKLLSRIFGSQDIDCILPMKEEKLLKNKLGHYLGITIAKDRKTDLTTSLKHNQKYKKNAVIEKITAKVTESMIREFDNLASEFPQILYIGKSNLFENIRKSVKRTLDELPRLLELP